LSLSPSQSLGLTGNFEPRIIAYSKTKSLIQKLTKESFLKGSDEFKLEEVIAEFERKGIDENFLRNQNKPALLLLI
jgi:hypothetical protein